MDELAEKYREYIKANNLLALNYESMLKNVLSFFGRMKVSEVTPFLIERYKLQRQQAKRVFYKGHNRREESKRPVRPASINRELAVLSRMFSIAVREKWVSANPVAGVPRLREDNMMERILTPEEEDALLAACDQTKSKYLRLVVTLALHTGCRLSEIVKLRWEQIDWGKQWITLIRTKNGKLRRVDINSKLQEVLSKLSEASNSEYVFPSQLRMGKSLSGVKSAFLSARKIAGIKGLRFHDLRHTWTTRLLDNGVSPAVVRDLGGWSDLSILNRYAHSTPEARKRAVESLVSHSESHQNLDQKCEQSVNGKIVAVGNGRK